jgi:hypothetical protein
MWNSSFWIVTSTLMHQGHQHLEATATAFFHSKPSHQLHLGLYIGWALLDQLHLGLYTGWSLPDKLYTRVLVMYVPGIVWKLVYITNMTCTKKAHQPLVNLIHVSVRHRCHRQRGFEGATLPTEKTPC